MAVGKRLRFEVFKRDGFTCQYCGRCPPQVVLEPDHILAESDGGPTTMENLVTACFDCNRGKSNVPLSSVPKPLADTMGEAMEKREQLAAYNQFLLDQRDDEDAAITRLSHYWLNRYLKPRQRGKYVFGDHGRNVSLRTFLRRLPEVQVMESMDIAADRVYGEFGDDLKRWKYFCGVCWGKIRDLEQG